MSCHHHVSNAIMDHEIIIFLIFNDLITRLVEFRGEYDNMRCGQSNISQMNETHVFHETCREHAAEILSII